MMSWKVKKHFIQNRLETMEMWVWRRVTKTKMLRKPKFEIQMEVEIWLNYRRKQGDNDKLNNIYLRW